MTNGASRSDLGIQVADSSKFLWTLMGIVHATACLYVVIFAYVGASLSTMTLGGGILILAPAVIWCERAKHADFARFTFLIACNYYVFISSLGAGHLILAEYYCLPLTMLGLLLFNFRQVPLIGCSILMPLFTWLLIRGHVFFGVHPRWGTADLPVDLLRSVNFLGAFAVVALILGAFIQASTRRHVELSLALSRTHQSEIHFRTMIEAMVEGMVIQNEKGAVTQFNSAALSILGLSATELLGTTSLDPRWRAVRENGEPFPNRERPAMQAMATGQVVHGVTMGVHLTDGKVRWVQVNAVPIEVVNASGNLDRSVICTFADITALHNATESASKRGAKLESLFQAMEEGMYMSNNDGLVEVCNDAALRLLGYERQDMIGSRMHDLIHQNHAGGHPHPADACPLHAALRDGTPYLSRYEVFWRRDGSAIPVSCTSLPVRLNGELQGSLVTFSDLTEQKRMLKTIEEQQVKMLNASKMSSLGEMAGGIAHEINTPLAIISAKAGQIRRRLEQDSVDLVKVTGELTKIELTAGRIGKIIQGLRAFSRNVDHDPMQAVPLSQVLDDALELCRERFKSHGIELRYSPTYTGSIECRPSQIAQIVMNLLANAHDAVLPLPEKWVAIEVVTHGASVELAVVDSGRGIPPAVAAKIMQPFFTTKEVGQGTGLGLSIAKGIADDHGGRLYYDDEAPQTRFVLSLPRRQAQPNQEIAA